MRRDRRYQNAMVRPFSRDQISRMLDPEDAFCVRYPAAYKVLASFQRAGITVSEARSIPHGYLFRVLGGVVVCVYTSGSVVAQGDVFENGATGKLLKRVLPKHTIWQR